MNSQDKVVSEVLSVVEAARFFGVSRSTFYLMLKHQNAPAAVVLSRRRRGYLVADLRSWLGRMQRVTPR